MNAPGYLLLVFLPLFYVVMWYGVLRLIAFLTGWTRFAERYPGVSTPTGERVRASTLGVGWGSYNNCVRFVADEEGLHISLWRIFSIGHAPLFIPWSEMHFESTRKVWGWGKTVKVSVGTPPVGRLQLPQRVFEAGQRMLANDPRPDPREIS
jgi:hypothetical protein